MNRKIIGCLLIVFTLALTGCGEAPPPESSLKQNAGKPGIAGGAPPPPAGQNAAGGKVGKNTD